MFDITPYLPLVNYLAANVHGRPPGVTQEQWVASLAESFANDPAFQQAVAGITADAITEGVVAQAFPGLQHIVDHALVPAVHEAAQIAVRKLQRRWSPLQLWGIAAAIAVVVIAAVWSSES